MITFWTWAIGIIDFILLVVIIAWRLIVWCSPALPTSLPHYVNKPRNIHKKYRIATNTGPR